jgi:hypothetical protein
VHTTLSEVPVSAVTAARLAAAVKVATVPGFAFNHPDHQVWMILTAAWPDAHEDDVPAQAVRDARAAAEGVSGGGSEAILAALNAASPHMPA